MFRLHVPDRQKFRNEDLVLKVSEAVDRARWDESKYDAFLDALCGEREYQRGAIRTALRLFLGNEYRNLKELARANYEANSILEARYGSFANMERNLQLPSQLSASIDLATGTGKSYVMYGTATILLAEGAVDRILVLCPSTTIESGLLEKFRKLAANSDLHDLLPGHSRIATPHIIDASQTITAGSICVENYHAILRHVGSSIRDSLAGKGERTAILNDEAHHVANESDARAKRWKEFLTDPIFGFRLVLGLSGTCYVKDEYFADVIYRYSLVKAMEQNFVKKVAYISEMPRTGDPDEKWQLIRNRHEETRRHLRKHHIRPLTIIVTPTIARCKDVGEELKAYLIDNAGLRSQQVNEQVLLVHTGAPDLLRLPAVDSPVSPVEWIVSVSMLNEGWDVKRVFQIVPHEERAFDSKLLIAQVLGRGLRIPDDWKGAQPEVVVFNHDAWAPRIRHLVLEVLEIEKRLHCKITSESPYHFDLHNIDYTLDATSKKKPMRGGYKLFEKGYVDLATESPSEEVSIEFERVVTGERYKWQTEIKHRTYNAHEIALAMFERLEQAQDPDDPDETMRTFYTKTFPVTRLEAIAEHSLARIRATSATESMKQKFLQSLGTLRRKASENVRYSLLVKDYLVKSTRERQNDSASAQDLRSSRTIYYTDRSRGTLSDEEVEFFDEVVEPGSGFKCVEVRNRQDFKTPLNLAIADHENERRFINMLVQPENVPHYDAWIKATQSRFYEIEFAWKKGEHPKRGHFSPDFFIKAGNVIIVVEIKGDEELAEPSEENRKKNEYGRAHFDRINAQLRQDASPFKYKFMFLTERSFNQFFQSLRAGTVMDFRSEMDVRLADMIP